MSNKPSSSIISLVALVFASLIAVAWTYAQVDPENAGPSRPNSPWVWGLAQYDKRLADSLAKKEQFPVAHDATDFLHRLRHNRRWIPSSSQSDQNLRTKQAMPSSRFAQHSGNAYSLFGEVQQAWVQHYASGLGRSSDVATDVTFDKDGNVYITGSSESPNTFQDYVTIKYNPDGIQQWMARYNGAGDQTDRAMAIGVDAAGNVYVTGESIGAAGPIPQYTTIKYNAAGRQEWVAHYDGPEGGGSWASDLAVDGAGNIYVTGRSWARNSSLDYVTIKYNSSGAAMWIARYNSSGSEDDYPAALTLDDSANVYVVGTSDVFNVTLDYITTVKYDASGNQKWASRYDGPGTDIARAIAVDDSHNVYVTATSEGPDLSWDYATIKYDVTGTQQWLASYRGANNARDQPAALAVDDSGNVFVTGGSYETNGNSDYVTIKYSTSGIQQWMATHSGPGISIDRATAMSLDRAGNVYVTGQTFSGSRVDYVTIKYRPAGTREWIANYGSTRNSEAAALAVDEQGNICVTGGSVSSADASDYATIKYNRNGIEQWVAKYNGTGGAQDLANALAIDSKGNVYVTGTSLTPDTTIIDLVTIKYNAAEEQEWIARFDSPGVSVDLANAIAVDAFDNVYVAGSSFLSGDDMDYLIVKYNSSGQLQWVARYDSPSDLQDVANALAVDASGNVYVTGRSQASGTDYDYATIKYSTTGEQEWVARYNSPANFADEATAIVLDRSGNVHVTGASLGAGRFSDLATIKYAPNGVEQWVARYDGPAGADDAALDMAIEPSGSLYVAGLSAGLATSYDYVVLKYSSGGAQEWEARYNGPANSNDQANALALDESGNVYVTGASVGNGTGADYATVKYDQAGMQRWVARFAGVESFTDVATALAVDGSGHVYVTGASWDPENAFDAVTLKYNSTGEQQWLARFDAAGIASDDAIAIALDAADNVYITGSSYGPFLPWSIYTTIKYEQTTVAVKEKPSQSIADYQLSQNHPNPFNPSTTIAFALPRASHVILKMFNLLGEEIATLVNGKYAAGRYQISWDAAGFQSGVYFYRLQAGEFVQTRKLVIAK